MRKSKSEIQMEQKMLVNKTLNTMKSFVNKLEPKIDYFIEKAKEAKAKNIPSQYNNAVRMIKATMSQKKRAEEMLLWFEMTNQMKEISEMSSQFFKGMEIVSVEMAKLTPKNKEFDKILRNIENGMKASNLQANQVNSFMERAGDLFDSFVESGDEEMISDKEVDALINGMLISEEAAKTPKAEEPAAVKEVKKESNGEIEAQLRELDELSRNI